MNLSALYFTRMLMVNEYRSNKNGRLRSRIWGYLRATNKGSPFARNVTRIAIVAATRLICYPTILYVFRETTGLPIA